ncbi:MAG: CCA tRNA nucleotidyltransferase [Alphaproteobacteria bacterium]|nr:CCA tRNA nucleotidyltransferase [Alphaproteobacteria bacterium]MDE2629572.1 CCA tRNA nucleotidyltransferase [Alphaproteobacteria bacterium]
MSAPATRKLMEALGEARFVGGAVRNALLGMPVTDIDIATPLTPDKIGARLVAAGIAFVPTGVEHGTLTAVVEGRPFEVTTLRRDVATDGRRAVVAFTDDWRLDAQRRDFTMNALYAAPDGEIFDFVGGVDDLNAGRVRFVGDAASRIREDYLRILRLFRFHAWYGKGEIDAEALRAAAAEKDGLGRLSGERIAKEMLRLLEAENPAPVLRLMRSCGILGDVLPGEANIARLESLAKIDAANFFAPDALLRLVALLADDKVFAAEVAGRWKLSNEARERLADIAGAREEIVPYLSVREARKLLYRLGVRPFKDRVLLKWAQDAKTSNAVSWRALSALGDAWVRPRFPLSGRDVMLAGVPQGPLVGQVLSKVEEWWIDSDFTDDEFSLAERLKAMVQAVAH